MPDSVREFLVRAAKNGEVIRIVYHGGSQPGTAREIVPLEVMETKIRARDFISHQDKIFKIEHIQIPSPTGVPPLEYVAPPPPEELVGSIRDCLIKQRQDMEALGWQVELREDYVALYQGEVIGSGTHAADVFLSYEQPTIEKMISLVISLDGAETEEREELVGGKRPYRLHSRRFAERGQPGGIRMYGRLSKAIEAFWQEARGLAPKS